MLSSGAVGVCALQIRWNPDVQRTKVFGRIKKMKGVHDNMITTVRVAVSVL